MPDTFQKFHYRHHSPSAVQRPLEIDIFQKALQPRGESMQFGAPVAVGRAVEDYTSASVIDGLRTSEALRHAMTALDAHEAVAWDRDNDQQRLDLHRDSLETIALHAVTGVKEALAGANQVTGQERLEKSYPGLHLPL